MRTTAGTSSPLSSPTSGFSTTPVKWPPSVSRSAPPTSAYSWRAVQRIAGLERERALPLAVADQRARHARREHVLAVLGVDDLRQRAQLAARELRAHVLLDHAPARMVEAVGAVDALHVLVLVPVETLDVVEDRHDAALVVAHRSRAAARELRRLVVRDRQRERDRPRVRPPPTRIRRSSSTRW
jgi:hypothetical protein